jgi:serine/threonine protein kinase
MSNKIGRFEILSEITHSDLGSVYKASDPESNQTVALKTVRLEPLGEQAAVLVKSLLEEAEASKVLNSHNISLLYGAGEVDGVFCACLEYVQGNSVATMLARKEGFSIWDLQDIARQTCQGLDHAHAKKVVHYTLEPAKIMVTWDGTVKTLGFGISMMSAFAAQASGKAPEVLHYMSPEQLRGDPLDARSNLFSLGAILYEMVTERKAFEGEDADQVRQGIVETTPEAPDQVNRKVHPALSEVIMKALSKDPQERYQSGQELVNDLERCKESATKAAAKPSELPQKAASPQKMPAPAASAQTVKPSPATAAPAAKTNAANAGQKAVSQPAAPAAKSFQAAQTPTAPKKEVPATHPPASKAAAAAAGRSGGSAKPATSDGLIAPNLDLAAPVIKSPSRSEAVKSERATMSSAPVVEPEYEAPKIAVDPMMDENRQTGDSQGRSFSEIDELPPLKEVYIAPPPPPPAESEPDAPVYSAVVKSAPPEKPKVKPREVAQKAVKEIKQTPPQLFLGSMAAAVGVILLVVAAIAWHIHSQNAEEEGTPAQSAAATVPSQPDAGTAQSATPSQAPTAVQVAPEPVPERPAVSVKPKYSNAKKARSRVSAAPAIVPGQVNITSTPAGAQVQIDGRNNSAWVTPYNLAGLLPGQHSVTISKPGYAPETRNIEVASGSKSFLSVQLAQVSPTAAVTSDPPGAAVWMDGRNTGRVTPAQIAVDKPGNHTFIFKKQGYLDETVSVNLQVGQTSHLSASLRVLGSTDEIKIGGKFKKVFGGGDTAGMGTVSVKTQPKGAQIAVNSRIVDKASPVQFFLNPGNYEIDITLSGFKSIHRVITVDKNGKVAVDETMDRE